MCRNAADWDAHPAAAIDAVMAIAPPTRPFNGAVRGIEGSGGKRSTS